MWPLKCIEHVVLVQQRDCDPEFFPGEPLEPADCKKVFFFSVKYRVTVQECRTFDSTP